MKKRFISILTAAMILLTGCSGNTPSGNPSDSSEQNSTAPQTESTDPAGPETEEITVGFVTYEAPDVSGEPVITDNNSMFYRYAGKRWWVDYSEPAAEFVLRDGKYSPFFDYEHDPAAGAGLEQGFAIYPTVESFNDGGWKYIGSLTSGASDSQRYFYLSPDGETILQFFKDDGYAEVADGEKLFTVNILVASEV